VTGEKLREVYLTAHPRARRSGRSQVRGGT